MKFGLYFLLIGLLYSQFICAGADEDKARALHEVQSKIQQVGADVKTLAAEKNAQLEQLKKLEKNYGEMLNAISLIKAKIAKQEQVLQAVRNQIVGTQKNLRIQQQGLEGLIKAVAAMGDKDNLKIVLNPSDPSLASRMSVYYDYIAQARLQKLAAIQEDYETLKRLESEKDTDAQLLQISLDKKQQETDALQVIKNQREKLLAQIDNHVASKNQQLQMLELDAKKLASLVASLQKTTDNEANETVKVPEVQVLTNKVPETSPEPTKPVTQAVSEIASHQPFASLKGQLPWPTAGEISERFGRKLYEMSSDGVVINAREGADVHAVAAGRVVYADWLRGYGLMVIVDHGQGYMSLYAYNQSINKTQGAQVKAGETIASVGRSGGRVQAALYFGIRIKGRPVNPESWCR